MAFNRTNEMIQVIWCYLSGNDHLPFYKVEQIKVPWCLVGKDGGKVGTTWDEEYGIETKNGVGGTFERRRIVVGSGVCMVLAGGGSADEGQVGLTSLLMKEAKGWERRFKVGYRRHSHQWSVR
ncbi:hypothetical protein HPP92_029131 [Vanilla planifolia]|uniref:Uncharacterized protein n=1 Tax=Vanilla planifolia TaxID=51239 RepID=A0A835P5X7_VANPL|nr:hypothetical protein HPP92_029131 [Vanilla planifolia]KAG0445874.1 hypothetical protein HPP92_029119 [Vanilla planifolia]